MNTLLSPSLVGALHSVPGPASAHGAAGALTPGAATATQWRADGAGGLLLRAEVEPQAHGLSVQAHAQRVLEALGGGASA